MKFEDIEIMSPVGSYESLMGAIQGGNSVYFGVAGLNMRYRIANNFIIEDLRNIFLMSISQILRRGDKLYKLRDVEV